MSESAHAQKSTTGRTTAPLFLRSAMTAMGLVAPPFAARFARSLYFRPQRLRARPAEREVLSRGTRFILDDLGTPVTGRSWGSGPVVVLVHGWSGHLGQMTALVEPLTGAGFKVVGFDWPGHGDSAGEASSLLHATRVLSSMQQLFGPFHGVVAHSFGAAATIVASTRGLEARRLVFHAPVARLDGYVNQYSTAFGFSTRQRTAFVDACEAWLEAPFAKFEPIQLAPRVERPTLIIHSEDDREVELADVEVLSKALNAELRTKQALGHRKSLRDAECLRETVDFLTAGSRAAAGSSTV